MASQEDPRGYEAEDEDFLDREENYVVQKSANTFVSSVTAKNRREPSHQEGATKNGSSRKTQPPAGAPRKASTYGIVAQAVQKMETNRTLAPPPQPMPLKKQKHDKKRKEKHPQLTPIAEDCDDDSLTMNDIFPRAFEKDGSSRAITDGTKSGNRSSSIYIPVFQQPWNEKSIMYLHTSSIGATNVGTQYMKDLEFDDDDHSLDIVDVFPALLNKTSLKLRRIEPPPPAPKRIVASVQAAAKRAEAAIAKEKAHTTVSQKPPDSKGRGYPLSSHPRPIPQGSDELPMDSALKLPMKPADDTKVALERKKSKKIKKSTRKKSRKHIHEEDGSVEDEEARRERHRRKKEKKAKKKAKETGEEKSRKKKKQKKRSKSESHLLAEDNSPNRGNNSMPELQDKSDVGLERYSRDREKKKESHKRSDQQIKRIETRAGLDDYIRDREAAHRQSMTSLQSGRTTVKKSNVAKTQSAISPQSDGRTTVKPSNVAKKESRAPRRSEEEVTVDRSSFLKNNLPGKSKEKEPLSDSGRSRKTRAERKATDAGLSDSARSRKAERKAADDSLSDSARFRKAHAEARKVNDARLASGERNATIKPLSPQKESLTVSSTYSQSAALPIKSRPATRPPETRARLKDSSQASLERDQNMVSIGKFDMLDAVDAAVQTKKDEKRTSSTKPSVPSIADTKKKKSRNIFKSILFFSRKAETDGEGAEQSRPRHGLFGSSKQSKTKVQRARSVPKLRGAQDGLMNEYLHTTSKTDSKTSWNDSIEENKLRHSPSRPTKDLIDMKYTLGAPPGDRPGTSFLLQNEYSTRRRRRKEEEPGSFISTTKSL